MKENMIIEVCIDSVESAMSAERGGADRVELCADLFSGGTTPSAGCMALARKSIGIALNVIIRPRGGDFLYSEVEYEAMKIDIKTAKENGADGVVFGILKEDGSVDMERNKELLELARPMSATFHRAFDMTADPFKALEDIISLGFDRILTSGQERTALEGIDLLTELVEKAADRIIIMPGAGVTDRNINKLAERTGAKEFHTSGRVKVKSEMKYQKAHVFMGGELRAPEYEIAVVSAEKIAGVREAIL